MPIDASATARAPSLDPVAAPTLSVSTGPPTTAGAHGVPVGAAGDVPAGVGLDRDRGPAAGSDAGVGTIISLKIPRTAIALVAWLVSSVVRYLGIPLGPGYPVTL